MNFNNKKAIELSLETVVIFIILIMVLIIIIFFFSGHYLDGQNGLNVVSNSSIDKAMNYY